MYQTNAYYFPVMLGLGLGLGMWGLGLGLGLACQRLVNNVLPLKLSSCMSLDAFDCTMFQLCYRLNLLTIDLLIKTWFYAVVCKFKTLILSFEVWGLGLGLEDLWPWPWPWPCIGWPWPWTWPWRPLALALYCLALALALTLLALLTSLHWRTRLRRLVTLAFRRRI